jgi:hypothetical protein
VLFHPPTHIDTEDTAVIAVRHSSLPPRISGPAVFRQSAVLQFDHSSHDNQTCRCQCPSGIRPWHLVRDSNRGVPTETPQFRWESSLRT